MPLSLIGDLRKSKTGARGSSTASSSSKSKKTTKSRNSVKKNPLEKSSNLRSKMRSKEQQQQPSKITIKGPVAKESPVTKVKSQKSTPTPNSQFKSTRVNDKQNLETSIYYVNSKLNTLQETTSQPKTALTNAARNAGNKCHNQNGSKTKPPELTTVDYVTLYHWNSCGYGLFCLNLPSTGDNHTEHLTVPNPILTDDKTTTDLKVGGALATTTTTTTTTNDNTVIKQLKTMQKELTTMRNVLMMDLSKACIRTSNETCRRRRTAGQSVSRQDTGPKQVKPPPVMDSASEHDLNRLIDQFNAVTARFGQVAVTLYCEAKRFGNEDHTALHHRTHQLRMRNTNAVVMDLYKRAQTLAELLHHKLLRVRTALELG